MPLALLQDTLAAAADTAARVAAAPPADPSFTDTLAGGVRTLALGGPVMIPILLLSVLTLAVFVERLRALRRAHGDPDRLSRTVADHVQRGDVGGAVAYCRSVDTPAARLLLRGLERLGRPIGEIREGVEEAGRREVQGLEKRIDLLASAASLAPMLGLLGTVTGMIRAFRAISTLEGAVSPAVLAGGISEALVATAAGLAVGITALFGYNLLVNRTKRIAGDLEGVAADFLEMLQAPVRRS